MIEQLSIERLHPHPENRPLGINQEKVEQIAEMMRATGYDYSKPIKVRPHGEAGQYQIIEGEHRWRAATKAGIDTVPCFIVEVDDEEALIQLVAGNVQTDSHPLDFGYVALELCQKDSKKGLSFAALAKRVGKSEDAIQKAVRGATVHRFLKQSRASAGLLDKSEILYEIRKCNESDWLWFHDIIAQKDLSKTDAIEISKRIRAIDTATATGNAAQVYDLTAVKQEMALAKERVYVDTLSTLEAIEECGEKLPETITLWRYSSKDDEIQEYEYTPRAVFLSLLKDKQLTRQSVFKAYTERTDLIRQMTKHNAEKDAEHYRDKANREEAQERARAEWEAFMPEPGNWYHIGRHRLYCGNNTDKAFIEQLPKAAFAFADPPYNEGVDEWDTGFTWKQDYLQEYADVVAVTPGISAVKDFFANSKMNYVWAHSTYISNGMTRGALGFGNFILTLLFTTLESIHKNSQDVFTISISNNDPDHYHKGRKPLPYMVKMIELFTKAGDTVIDPFLGSGTTLEACEQSGRTCYGAEMNPIYCKKIMEKFNKNGGN